MPMTNNTKNNERNLVDWLTIEAIVNEIVEIQKKQLLSCARRIIPHLTSEDILQPNDFPELENNPNFRYEEGILAGIQTVQMALRAQKGMQGS
jgi:hypothetical protein